MDQSWIKICMKIIKATSLAKVILRENSINNKTDSKKGVPEFR